MVKYECLQVKIWNWRWSAADPAILWHQTCVVRNRRGFAMNPRSNLRVVSTSKKWTDDKKRTHQKPAGGNLPQNYQIAVLQESLCKFGIFGNVLLMSFYTGFLQVSCRLSTQKNMSQTCRKPAWNLRENDIKTTSPKCCPEESCRKIRILGDVVLMSFWHRFHAAFMQVSDRKEHVRNLQETCRKTASKKKAKPAKLSLIAISKC